MQSAFWQEISKETDHISGIEFGRLKSNITEIYCEEVHYTHLDGCKAQRRGLMLLRP